jgi:selenocysteine lyase/cysteine desulfurase
VSGFVVGEQYRLDFQQAAESHDNFAEEDSVVNVSISGATPASADFSADSVAAGNYFADWKAQSLVFTANATTLTFTFVGVASEQNDVESGIDNISVSRINDTSSGAPIPTLSAYGLLLAILVLLVVGVLRLRQ